MLGTMLTHWTVGACTKKLTHRASEGRLLIVQGIHHKGTQSSRSLVMGLFPNVLGRGNFDIPNEPQIYGVLGTRSGSIGCLAVSPKTFL